MPKQKKTLTNNTNTRTQIHTRTDTHREYVWKKSLYNPNSWKSQTGSTARHRLDIARSRKLNNPNGRINKTQNAGRHRSHSPSLSLALPVSFLHSLFYLSSCFFLAGEWRIVGLPRFPRALGNHFEAWIMRISENVDQLIRGYLSWLTFVHRRRSQLWS